VISTPLRLMLVPMVSLLLPCGRGSGGTTTAAGGGGSAANARGAGNCRPVQRFSREALGRLWKPARPGWCRCHEQLV
jgi:hypothetical protein